MVSDLDWISESTILNFRLWIGYGVYEKILDPIRLQNFNIRTPLVQSSSRLLLSGVGLPMSCCATGTNQRWEWTGWGLDILQDTCNYFGSGLDLDIYFKKNWIRTGSGYTFDFYKEIFLRVIQDVTNDGAVVFFAMIFIFTKNQNDLSICAALITNRW